MVAPASRFLLTRPRLRLSAPWRQALRNAPCLIDFQGNQRMALPSEVIDSPRVPRIGPYSQAVRVGDLVYTAGQPGIDPTTGRVAGDSFEAQARQAFANLQAVLEDGGSSLARVIKVTCFVADPDAFPVLNTLFAEFFPVAPPVRSTPLVQLPRGLLFSIDAVAVVDRG
ncbi:MAG TPA: RidA family protein [Gemmatimonadaceae bacterium]|nr:RidA family protein [Gemmatimonadaceae bacterium]